MNTEFTRLVVQEKVTDMMRSAEHARLARGDRPGRRTLSQAGGRITQLLAARHARGAVQPSADPCAEHAS